MAVGWGAGVTVDVAMGIGLAEVVGRTCVDVVAAPHATAPNRNASGITADIIVGQCGIRRFYQIVIICFLM